MISDRIKNIQKKLLSDNWYILNKYTFDYKKKNGSYETQHREIYDRGNGATILLYNKKNKTVVLTSQFRMSTYLNGNTSGMLIETCAGLLDKDNPEDCIRRETEEETGYKVTDVRKVMECYMSPGSVTELIHFFVAEYDASMKISEGGGIEEETEELEVLELPFQKALKMIETGEIKDGKTIMLLHYALIHKLV